MFYVIVITYGAELTHSQRSHFSLLTHSVWVNSLIPVKLNTKFKFPTGVSRCSWNSFMNSRLSSSTWSFALPWNVLLCLPSDILPSHRQMYTFSMLLHLLHVDSCYKLNSNTSIQWKKRANPFSSLSPHAPKWTLQKLCVSEWVKASAESLCSLPNDHSCVPYFHQVSPYIGSLLYVLWAKGQSVFVF